MTPSCRSCGVPVVPGHTAHDGPLVDGEETWWCEPCCQKCAQERNERGDSVKQTIEVEVKPGHAEDDFVVVWPTGWQDDVSAGDLRDMGLTVPEPTPERTEYALITRVQRDGQRAVYRDEVLVAAHSLRVGDRIEWAPGDWREITKVDEHPAAITIWFGEEPSAHNRWDLLAVRRS